MPIIKLSLMESEHAIITELAKNENLSIQDYIRYKMFGEKRSSKFTPEEAERRALEKYALNDDPFTLPDIYENEWKELEARMSGVFGKRFFNYLKKKSNAVAFAGMSVDGRRATYKIVKEENNET